MTIHTKIMATILPLVFVLLLATVGISYHFSRQALTELAETWLETRLSEALQIAIAHDQMLRRYGLEDVPASIAKAKMDAAAAMAAIEVGDLGYIFVLDQRGRVAIHPDPAMIGQGVGQETWFKELTLQRSRLIHPTPEGHNLAMVDFFEPWGWYILASDPEREVYGVANRMKPYLIYLGLVGFGAMTLALTLLTRHLTAPLRLLTAGAEKIGRGDIEARIAIRSQDEFGRLAGVFNDMARRLQETLSKLQQSHQRLEARVVQRTEALFAANSQLQQEIEERIQMSRDKEKLQHQLFQAQKMEAIGTLAGGIAHDFNNLLMGIQGNVELMALEMDPDHTRASRLKTIQDCVESGARLARQLLGFARLGKYEIQSTDINALARETTDMFGRTRQELRIIQKYQENVWPVEADRVQIEQVLLNLFINAWQAMPDGGDLFLETANTTLDDRQASAHGVEPGKYVKITLADTGMGMDPATMERIFDPFFTTKAMGRGTGLGLASAYGIVRNHGGVIAVNSRKGDGTTFQVYLRASAKPSLGTGARIPPSTQVGCETVLLVDDDPLILDVGQAMLKRLGYSVQVARGGQEALAAYRTHGDQIDLVILDMIMPDMGGGKTYDQLKAMRPDIKVLLSSGYSIDGQAATIMNRGCSGFIQKPFDLQTFSDKIRSILDG